LTGKTKTNTTSARQGKLALSSFSGKSQSDRIGEVVQQWFLTEPLLFAAWTTHQVTANPSISTIRVGKGQLEYNNDFIRGLDKATLREVMKFETLRIILKHPYERRKPNVEFALTASNISIFECLNSSLPMPSAEATFDDDKHNKKYFEYYYNLLVGRKRQPSESNDRDKGGNDKDESQDAKNENQPEEENQSCESEDDPSPNDEKKEGGDSNCDSGTGAIPSVKMIKPS
jgi:hypothetical protein